jgi:hypothetical protein
MARIDGIDALAAMMRQQVRSLGRGATGRVDAGATEPNRPERKKKVGKGDLAAVVSRRVAALDKTDPDVRRKAFRIFLEAVLLAEFGEELINDSAFQGLVDDTVGQMSADPALAEAMQRAAGMLLPTGD